MKLWVLEGDTAGAAYSINSHDQIVGRSVMCTKVNPDDCVTEMRTTPSCGKTDRL